MEFPEMKDRISHIIRAKNLTAAEFAIQLGIQPSNVSHLLSGRNNPSLDFVKKLKETFPEYSLDWIVFGQGPMTVSDSFRKTALEPTPVDTPATRTDQFEIVDNFQGTLFEVHNMVEEKEVDEVKEAEKEKEAKEEKTISGNNAALEKIIFVYSDHTFEEILPR